MYPIYHDNSRITLWGCMKDPTCTPLKWRCGNACTWDNSTQESRLYQKVWAQLKDSRAAPQSIRTQWNRNHQPDVYLKTDGDHANQWRIYKSRPKWGIYPSVASKMWRVKKSNELKSSIIECAIQVIHVYNWIRPIDQRGISRKEAWRNLSVEKCKPN